MDQQSRRSVTLQLQLIQCITICYIAIVSRRFVHREESTAVRRGCLIESCGKSFVNGEIVDSVECVWCIARTEDLLARTLPFRLVDSIDPVLNLHDETVVLVDSTWAAGDIEETLSLLEGESTYGCQYDVECCI